MVKLIVAPTEFEMKLLQDKIGCAREEGMLDFILYRGSYRSKDIVLVKSGPGMANAAAATALALERFKPEHVFHVGVCGAYSEDMSMLKKVVVGTQAVFADTGVDNGEQFHTLQSVDLALTKAPDTDGVYNIVDLAETAVAKRLQRGCFLTVAASSGSFERASKIKSRFCAEGDRLCCEDMESASVGLMALKAGIPCTVIRAVSNLCGDRDYKHWKLSEAAEAAQKELLKCL